MTSLAMRYGQKPSPGAPPCGTTGRPDRVARASTAPKPANTRPQPAAAIRAVQMSCGVAFGQKPPNSPSGRSAASDRREYVPERKPHCGIVVPGCPHRKSAQQG